MCGVRVLGARLALKLGLHADRLEPRREGSMGRLVEPPGQVERHLQPSDLAVSPVEQREPEAIPAGFQHGRALRQYRALDHSSDHVPEAAALRLREDRGVRDRGRSRVRRGVGRGAATPAGGDRGQRQGSYHQGDAQPDRCRAGDSHPTRKVAEPDAAHADCISCRR